MARDKLEKARRAGQRAHKRGASRKAPADLEPALAPAWVKGWDDAERGDAMAFVWKRGRRRVDKGGTS